MTVWLARSGAWLALQAASLPDTIVTIQAQAKPSWFQTVSSLASIAISIALLALAVGLIPAAWNFRKSYKKANDLLDRVYADVTPLVRHAHTVADNLDYITTAIRVDFQQVSRTINTANERLLVAVKTSERRLAEFNALLRVMQEEAEDVFVATAATVRGVREGAATFGEEMEEDMASPRARLDARLARLEALAAEAEEAQDELAIAQDPTDDLMDDLDEVTDGDDYIDERALPPGDAGEFGTERPRIRPRPRREG